jgi:acetyl esterase/lipase
MYSFTKFMMFSPGFSAWLATLPVILLSFLFAWEPVLAAENNMTDYTHLRSGDSIQSLITHPAFKDFGQQLLPRESDISRQSLPLDSIQSLLPYHGHVDTKTVLDAINHMVDEAADGKTLFYDFYTEQQRQSDPAKSSTGLFFFRGKPGAPFAIICPGGGFSYVGSVHEGFPYALELSKKGFNAFVLKYRVGRGGNAATQDLAMSLSYIINNAAALGVSTKNYSLWGSSAGARMAASVASHGVAGFGGDALPGPAAVIMAYTGHSDFSKNDPPTFVTVSENDSIVNVASVEKRIREMRKLGIEVEYLKFKNAGHGFGPGVGTDAEGWIEQAIGFWEKQISR